MTTTQHCNKQWVKYAVYSRKSRKYKRNEKKREKQRRTKTLKKRRLKTHNLWYKHFGTPKYPRTSKSPSYQASMAKPTH
jgi:hypothetical protein